METSSPAPPLPEQPGEPPPTPAELAAAGVFLTGPMRAYRCNRKGCCCSEWQIHFRGDDIVRLAEYLPPAELPAAVGDGLIVVLDEERQRLDHFELALRGEEQRCRFLGTDGGCTLQQRFGVASLPSICVDFPVACWRIAGRVELGFVTLCPGVLDAIFASPEPTRIERVTELDEMFLRRLERVDEAGAMEIGGVELAAAELLWLRDEILRGLEDVQRPALEQLQAIGYGLAAVIRTGDPRAFELRYDQPAEPFARFFGHALASHDSRYLAELARRYGRFVFEPELQALLQPGTGLEEALERWPEGLVLFVEPAEEPLRPFLNRFLAHRYFNCLGRFVGEATVSFGRVTHVVATALRFAAAFCWIGRRPLDAPTLKLALGVASFCYHNALPMPEAAPWFVPEHFAGAEPPPPQWCEGP